MHLKDCVKQLDRRTCWQASQVFFFCFFFFLLGPHPWHMEVVRLWVVSELQLPAYTTAYTTATATRDPSRVYNLHLSWWQCHILKPLSKARVGTHILMDTSWIVSTAPQQELPSNFFFFFFFFLFRAASSAYGNSQVRGLIAATAAGLCHTHSYSNSGSKPCLRPTPQLMAAPDL